MNIQFTAPISYYKQIKAILNDHLFDGWYENYDRTFDHDHNIVKVEIVNIKNRPETEKLLDYIKLKYPQIKENNMDLKQNYERFFGKMETFDKLGGKTKNTVQEEGLTPQQQNFWTRVNSAFAVKYPKRHLENKNGNITVDGYIVESTKEFFKRDLSGMTTKIRTLVQRLGD